MSMSNARATNNKPKRVYKKITTAVIAQHKIDIYNTGNGTSAVVKNNSGDYLAPQQRAYNIMKKDDSVTAVQYIDEQLQVIGKSAIDRVEQMIQSENEQIATKNSHFAIDHIRGKALQRNISATIALSPESILD